MRCTEVADRPLPNGKFTRRDIGDRGRSGIRNPILHDVLIALKRVNVERHIDVDRDVGSAFEVAKKWWAKKRAMSPQVFHFFAHHFSAPLSLISSCVSCNETIKR